MQKKGMTKIELLIVLTIVALLAIVAMVSVSSARLTMRDSLRLSDISGIQAGLELYFNDFNEYPPVEGELSLGQVSTQCLSEAGFTSSCTRSIESVYIETLFAPPEDGLSGDVTCSGMSNVYCYSAQDGEYRLRFELENDHSVLGLQKGINCATESGVFAGDCSPIIE